MTFAGKPLWLRQAARWAHCVDLPDRSRPSTTMNNAERQQPVLWIRGGAFELRSVSAILDMPELYI